MPIHIKKIDAGELLQYAAVPISFLVDSIFHVEVVDRGLGGLQLVEEAVAQPYIKDYDAYDGERPTDWPNQFEVGQWGFFLAVDGEQPVGGAAVAVNTPAVHMLENRRDLAVLWDIRVHPDWRGRGVGARLLRHAADWAQAQGCRQLKIETQNVNVRACRFYARQGCVLGSIHRYGYAGVPAVAHEAMLLWYLDL